LVVDIFYCSTPEWRFLSSLHIRIVFCYFQIATCLHKHLIYNAILLLLAQRMPQPDSPARSTIKFTRNKCSSSSRNTTVLGVHHYSIHMCFQLHTFHQYSWHESIHRSDQAICICVTSGPHAFSFSYISPTSDTLHTLAEYNFCSWHPRLRDQIPPPCHQRGKQSFELFPKISKS
jgi:hypothetical protein